ncbi:tRNA (adenosine(37)-N6)-threonylcarbamoyltransferase complex ATPase subunit type 1 TsaE [Chelatococcus sp. SYSU_G07232]|uniref:tRNA threonylcarbamoyladenosine biosynthesis protein TsaE n=2 Tax=Chelatococcus albus TaxID=3047466 RepID=A0ABT7AHS3_9HYPH|nr:tRNA (adenosine(37)-N6)-threonylcarbamoyltransferase complex ATPase subunit type 1 TsaE [Chelatococcus sp. SYSU_G07232]MDJ1158903.1 tRNA (adenosine(37)-N6)-threonylcarbamoyltransferase complex ATPase subunit type 1 TsaE [Chelatococcus sp. SYSU_G07232]
MVLPDEAATLRLAGVLAGELKANDLVTLSGDLGAGKTTFARALVRALAGDPELEVPSPTFTLMQLYEMAWGTVVHADLYRIGGPEELEGLGWDEAADGALVLVEWPDRAGGELNADRLDIAFRLMPQAGSTQRLVVLTGHGAWVPRLERLKGIRTLLDRTGWGDASRVVIQGDASTRQFERLTKPSGETAILMIAPPRVPGPPVRRGKPYHVIARLSDTVHAFIAIDKGLRALGFSAPRIYGADPDAHLVLVEDLGTEPIVGPDGPIAERYGEGVLALAKLHTTTLPDVLPVTEGRDHVIPPYDLEALLIEAELLLEWYAPHMAQKPVSAVARSEFVSLWTRLLAEVVAAPATWTLRDFHSPNLFWLPEREGVARLGMIDFQDTVLGHPAYDLVSLLQDARVDVPVELELKLLAAYAQARRAHDSAFDLAAFTRAYAVLGAQRATKILGGFTRLDRRDGKPAYLRHMPRIEGYLGRNLAHPALADLRRWYETHLPQLVADA